MEKRIWDFLKSKGLSDCAVAGIMGNLYAESGLNPCNLQNTYEKKLGMTDAQYTAAVDNGSYTGFVNDSAGYGLAQWTYYSRKQALYNFARAAAASIGNLEMQLNFLWKELQGYTSVMNTLKTAATVLETSNAILIGYERPANQGADAQAKRAGFGQKYFDKYADTAQAEKGNKMNLNTLILTNNDCYKAGRKITVKGIMVHSTGANNPTLKRYVGPNDGKLGNNQYNNHWNMPKPGGRQVCVHAFIGKLADGSIATYQTLPWDMRGWHGGSGSKGSVNDTHIGFEICEDGLTDAAYFNAVYKEAAELCAYLCKMYNLNPTADGVIIGHYEGHARGVASNHGDPKNWFPKHGKSMDTFREYVKQLMGTSTPEPKPAPAPTTPAAPVAVKVGDIVQFTGGGVYTSSNAANAATTKGASRCKVTQVYNGKHPYHLISQDGKGVYGWVDATNVTANGTSTPTQPAAPSTPNKKTVDEIAKEVIRGNWGNGQDRVKRLTAAGYDAKAVQARVNQLLK